MEILQMQDVCLEYYTEYGETVAVKNLNLCVNEGDFVALVGPSGCGKTTILSLICGLIKPTSGKVLLNGHDVAANKRKIGYMLQHDQLFEWRSIRKNVLLSLEVQNAVNSQNIEYADKLIEKYGLKEFAKAHPNQLSGGMRQRAALIRTLAFKPDLLLLDEPFSALDYQTRLEVAEDVSNIIRSEKKSAILVTHDISEAISIADKIAVLTARPATIKHVFELDFDTNSPLLRREKAQFPKWFDTIWKELKTN